MDKLGHRQVEVSDSLQFFCSQVDDFLLRRFQCRAECLEIHKFVESLVGRPVQKPSEVSQFLVDGRILQAYQVFRAVWISLVLGLAWSLQHLLVSQIDDKFSECLFREIRELDFLFECHKVFPHSHHLFISGLRPGILFSAVPHKLIINFEEITLLWFGVVLFRCRPLGNNAIYALFILFRQLFDGRNDIERLEILEWCFHLVLDIPKFVVDIDGIFSSWPFIPREHEFILCVPSIYVIDLAASWIILSLSSESYSEANLEFILVLSICE